MSLAPEHRKELSEEMKNILDSALLTQVLVDEFSAGQDITVVPVFEILCRAYNPFTPKLKTYILPTFESEMYKLGSENWWYTSIWVRYSTE